MSGKSASIKFFLIKLLLRCMAAMPLRVVHMFGSLLGHLMWHFDRRCREVALRNIELCLPELSVDERTRLAKRSTLETGKTITELGAMWFWPVQRTRGLIKQVTGEQCIQEALSLGRGVIFASPHIGAWELCGLYCETFGEMTTLYRPPKSIELDRMIYAARKRGGSKLVATDAKGVRSLFQALKRGGVTGILPDQDPGASGGEFAPFFGVQANTMTLLSKLAFKGEVPVILVGAERLPKGEGFHIHAVPVELDYQQANIQQSLLTLNQAIERLIRHCPEQYQWSYKRFKSQPSNMPNPYDT